MAIKDVLDFEGLSHFTEKIKTFVTDITSKLETNKANIASPILTGTPKAPTATAGTNTTQIATTAFVQTAVSNLVDSAPETLDTLGEIADALKDNADIVDVLNDSIATKANTSDLTSHTSNTTVHITATERTNWNDANSKKHTHSNKSILDSTTASYTTADKTKLGGIATGAEVNQNAFSNVVVGSTTISADSKTDSLTLAGSNVTLTPDATNDKVTIGITKANVTSALGYTPPTTNTTYGVATSSTLGLVKSGTDITVDSSGNVSVNDDSHNHTIANVDGLQTALDGKAATSHGTHVSYGTSASALGTSSAGSATTVSRSDHVHALPALTSCTGTLSVAKGGTGATDAATARTNLGITPANIGAAASSHTHSSYANQNAFSNVTIGSTTISADTTTDTLTLAAGSNVTITPDTTNDKITISSSHPTISKNTNTTSTASPSAGGTFTTIDSITQDSNGHVTKFNTKTVTLPSTSITVDSAVSSTSTNPVQNKAIYGALISHGTHVRYSTTAPVMDGTASVGTATTVARSDHKHPTDTSRASTSSVLSTVAQCTASTTSSDIAGASALAELNNSLIKVAVVSLNYECGTYDSVTDQYKGFIYNTDITIDKIEGAIKIIKFIPFAAISTSDAGRAGTIGWRESDKSLVINFSFSTTATVSFLVFYI